MAHVPSSYAKGMTKPTRLFLRVHLKGNQKEKNTSGVPKKTGDRPVRPLRKARLGLMVLCEGSLCFPGNKLTQKESAPEKANHTQIKFMVLYH